MNNILDVKMQSKMRRTKKRDMLNRLIRPNALVFLLAVFVAIATVQAFELGNMLSESKTIGKDIRDIRAGQEILLDQYTFYANTPSYYANHNW